MGFRFRRSIKICKGVKLNFSKSGISTTIGGKGASYTIGKGRRRANVGIPGTGLSYSVQTSTKSKQRKTKQQQAHDYIIKMDESGEIIVKYANGHVVTDEKKLAYIKKQPAYVNAVRQLYQEHGITEGLPRRRIFTTDAKVLIVIVLVIVLGSILR